MLVSTIRSAPTFSLSNNIRTESKGESPNLIASIADAVEELAMSRSQFQRKDKKVQSLELARFLEANDELWQSLKEVVKSGEITKETVYQFLSTLKFKDDVSRYQALRYLMQMGHLSPEIYQIINKEINKLKRKRKKITSLDLISGETAEIQDQESINGLILQRMYLDFLEYDGHITNYFDSLYHSSKEKYKKIAKFISRMTNYELFAMTPEDDMNSFIYINEKRRHLNMMTSVYDIFENKKDLSFIKNILTNVNLESICNQQPAKEVSFWITTFNQVPYELFYTQEDKEDALGTMRNNVTHRFLNNGIR